MRTPGAKNKPKTVAELVKLLEQAAEREQVNLGEIINKAKASDNVDDASKIAQDKLNKFSNLTIELEDGEVDTYKCGNCGEIMASEMPICPNCNARLNW